MTLQSLKISIIDHLFYTCIKTSLLQKPTHVASLSKEPLTQGTNVAPLDGPSIGFCVTSSIQIHCKKEGVGHEEMQKSIRFPF
jgi:hypothetical protein